MIYIMSGIKLLICRKLPAKYVKLAIFYVKIPDTKHPSCKKIPTTYVAGIFLEDEGLACIVGEDVKSELYEAGCPKGRTLLFCLTNKIIG